MNLFIKAGGGLAGVLLFAATVAAYHHTQSYQVGNAGLGMEVIETDGDLAEKLKANKVPPALPPASQDGQLAVDAYQNVRVLGHLSSGDFTRLMTAISIWVAPDAGCGYCHAPQRDDKGNVLKNAEGYALADPNNMGSDELYSKRVARRMIQMTMRINGEWKEHVKDTGVTCFTCHRGNPVPANIWFDTPGDSTRYQGMGTVEGTSNSPNQNGPTSTVGMASLPSGALRPYLASDENIRVQATEAIGSDDRSSIKQTEWTYGLMIHMSKSLGVNCAYCHNTRSFGDWASSPSPRAQAYYGIRMVRELNGDYLEPLASTFPAVRLGPLGDGPKVNCATCHAGAYKPLLGVSMLKDYSVLAEAKPQPQKSAVNPAPATDPALAAMDGGVAPMTGDASNTSRTPNNSMADANALDAGSKSPIVGKTQTQQPTVIPPAPTADTHPASSASHP